MEGFAGFMTKILEETGLAPELLQLELTESVLMESEPDTIQPLVSSLRKEFKFLSMTSGPAIRPSAIFRGFPSAA